VAGLQLTGERMAGRRHRIATVIVRRLHPAGHSRGDSPSGASVASVAPEAAEDITHPHHREEAS
jgi:hypothetical protein